MNKKTILAFALGLYIPFISNSYASNCVTEYNGFRSWGSPAGDGNIEGITITETCYTDSTQTKISNSTIKTYNFDDQSEYSEYWLDHDDQGELIFTNGNNYITLSDDNVIKVTEATGYNGGEHATQVDTIWTWPNGNITNSTNYFDENGNPVGYKIELNGMILEGKINEEGIFDTSIVQYDDNDNLIMKIEAIVEPFEGMMYEDGTMNAKVDDIKNIKIKSFEYGEQITETTCNVNSISSLSIEGLNIDYSSCQQAYYPREASNNLQNGSSNVNENQSSLPVEESRQIRRIYTVEDATAAVKGNKNTFSIRYR